MTFLLKNLTILSNNKDAIAEKKKAERESNNQICEKFDCACGGRFAHRHFSTHAKTDQHVKFVSSLNGSQLPPAVLSPVQQKTPQTREERLAKMREAHRLRMSDAEYREKEYQRMKLYCEKRGISMEELYAEIDLKQQK